MLNIVQQLPPQNDDQKQIAPLDFEPPEKVMRTYRELKKNDIKPEAINLSQRHNFFMRLELTDRIAATKILEGEESMFCGNSRLDMLDLVCKALKLTYEVDNVPNHPSNYKMFVFTGDFDSVHIGPEGELYAGVIRYMRTMLNIDNVFG